MKNKGRVLDRDTILTRIWRFDYDGDTRVVDTHIKRIRKTPNDKGKNIVTKVNVGYMFEEK
ncbi:winged helix-turn-helix domain-containing protein [Eshraghiella crossota]|uniref:winged helix-turn-helix domain-containing protein n=1 Tax=Eshraghiella crossota TaxID=45851 RepID=UPI004027725D